MPCRRFLSACPFCIKATGRGGKDRDDQTSHRSKREGRSMMLARILADLRHAETGTAPEAAARAGFVRWVLSLPPGVPVSAAAAAAAVRVRPQAGQGRAVALFLKCLDEACVTPERRGGARARRRGRA